MSTVTSALSRSSPAWRLPEKSESGNTATRGGERQHARAQVLGERARIAREIHDVLARSLGTLGIEIEAARSLLTVTGDIPAAISLLERASQLVDDGLSEAREAIFELRPDAPPLSDGLASLLGTHEEHYRRPVAVSVTGAVCTIRPDANMALISVAREALTNAARHAPGAAVTVHLDYTPTQVTLTLSNPASPPPAAGDGKRASGTCYGLAGMRERLQLTGGTVSAGLSGGEWIVRAQVPL
jgi:signal transduction histidine kinase